MSQLSQTELPIGRCLVRIRKIKYQCQRLVVFKERAFANSLFLLWIRNVSLSVIQFITLNLIKLQLSFQILE